MESMGSHLQDNHQEEFLENSFSTLLSWSAVQKMGVKSCPLCSSCGVEDSPELVNHVLQHTYEFALRSLPWPQPIIHNLNVPPGGFDLSVNSSHAEELRLGDTEDIQIYNAEDGQRLTAGNLQRLKAEGIRHWTAAGIQLWIKKEVHERKEAPELQLTDYDRADHSAPDDPEFFGYSNYFLTNQYFGDGSDGDKSSEPQRDRSIGNSIAVSTGTNRSVWNEAESLETQVITAAANEVDAEEELKVLLKGQEGNIVVTKGIVEAAARNKMCGKQVMRLLIIQPVEHVTIKEEAVASIAENFDGEMMVLLLDKRGDQFIITENIVKAAARNLRSGIEVMVLLLDRRGDQIMITDSIMRAAARNLRSGNEMMALLLDRRGDQITDTESIVEAAKYNLGIGIKVMELLLAKQAKNGSNHTGDVRPPPTSIGLGSLQLDALAPHLKKSGDDWLVVFNPQAQHVLDVDAAHTLHHDSVVCSVRFSRDGRFVATGSSTYARIFDAYTGEEICRLQCGTVDTSTENYVRSVCFSPNGKYLATASEDKTVRVSKHPNVDKSYSKLIVL